MGLLAKCPKCGCTIAKDTTCPNCYLGGAAPSSAVSEEFARRQAIHKRNYTIFMGSAMLLGLTTLLLIIAIFMVTKGRAVARAVTPGQIDRPLDIPQLDPGDPDDVPFDDGDDAAMPDDAMPDDAMEDMVEEDMEAVPALSPDDFDYSYFIFWLVIILGLTVAEGALAFVVVRCRQWWPIELHCPGCETRLDELGGNLERCPSCLVPLQ